MAAPVPAEPLDIAWAGARAGLSYPFVVWHFGDSVYLDSLLSLAEADQSCGAEFASFAYGMTKAWVAHTTNDFTDHTAPGAAIVRLWRRTGDPHLLAAATALATLWDRFPRCATAEAFLHTFQRHSNIAIDCAHFDGPFFAELASATGEERYAERAVYELQWRMRLLQDDASGLVYHSYDCARGRRGTVLWGRGHGWALLGLVETLRALPQGFDGSDELRERLEALAWAMVHTQDASGHWHTVVDDGSSYLESSVAAFFVAAVASAVDAGLLPGIVDELAEPFNRAWRAVSGAVDAHGVLTGVSAETPTTLSPTAYREVPCGGTYPWGQGPLVLAALGAARAGALTCR